MKYCWSKIHTLNIEFVITHSIFSFSEVRKASQGLLLASHLERSLCHSYCLTKFTHQSPPVRSIVLLHHSLSFSHKHTLIALCSLYVNTDGLGCSERLSFIHWSNWCLHWTRPWAQHPPSEPLPFHYPSISHQIQIIWRLSSHDTMSWTPSENAMLPMSGTSLCQERDRREYKINNWQWKPVQL